LYKEAGNIKVARTRFTTACARGDRVACLLAQNLD
jgi:hypothetical protein